MKDKVKTVLWAIILTLVAATIITIGWYETVQVIQKDNPEVVFKNKMSLTAVGYCVDGNYYPVTKSGDVVVGNEIWHMDKNGNVFVYEMQ